MNSTGAFTLNVPLLLNLYGNFTSGILISSGTNSLTFIDNATTSGASDVSHVAGPVIKIGNDNFEFPIGKSGSYAPATLGGGGSTSDSYTSEYFAIAPHAIPTDTVGKDPSIGLMNRSEHWSFTGPGSSRSLGLSYNSSRTTPIIDHTELIMIQWDGTAWKDRSGTVSGTASAGTVTRGANTLTGLFSIASTFRVLPIELLDFKAEATQNKDIRVSWTTASEKNNAFFTLEKSLDGKQWFQVALIPGAGDSQEQLKYEFIDKDVRYGRQFYRLTQTDFDGQFETSYVIGISLIQEQGRPNSFLIYPNPSSGRFTLQAENMNLNDASLEIYDMNGSLVLKAADMENKRQEFDLSYLPKGVYVIKIFSFNRVEVKKLIID
jgi:hypothetical protein